MSEPTLTPRSDVEPAPPRIRATKNTAILVIHGIGEQDPYETLDHFASGCVRYFGDAHLPAPKIRPERINHGDWSEVALHLDFAAPVTKNGLEHLCLHEFYWAPYTEGKMTYQGVVRWLMRTALTPLRYLSDNLYALLDAYERKNERTARRLIAAWLLVREALRTSLVYLPALVVLVLFGGAGLFAVKTVDSVPVAPLQTLLTAMRGSRGTVLLAISLISWAMTLVFVLLVLNQLPHWKEYRTEAQARRVWLWLAGLVILVSVAVDVVIARRGGFNPLTLWAQRRVLAPPVLALCAAAVALVVHRILVAYVADISVYVTADEKAPSYQARSAILDACCDAVARLLAPSRNYDQVIIAGHSLGSAIAYDTINELLSRTWATADGQSHPATSTVSTWDLAKLKGLVTFGSPLDKIYYFFREHVPDNQPVRAQILSFLHSFRRQFSGRDYGALRFAYASAPPPSAYAFPQLGDDFRWLNVWSRMDPVSGPLIFYRLRDDDRMLLRYRMWGVAHLAYWSDDRLYRFIAERLL